MSSVSSDPDHVDTSNGKNSSDNGNNGSHGTANPLHRISEVRQREGVSLRTIARHWDVDVASIRSQEEEGADLRLSDLYRWQTQLNVPISELLIDQDQSLSAPVMRRAQLVRLMKTAATLNQRARQPSVQRLVAMLIQQLHEIMPELEEVGPWRGNEDGVLHLEDDEAAIND